jgi:hypothetical protein
MISPSEMPGYHKYHKPKLQKPLFLASLHFFNTKGRIAFYVKPFVKLLFGMSHGKNANDSSGSNYKISSRRGIINFVRGQGGFSASMFSFIICASLRSQITFIYLFVYLKIMTINIVYTTIWLGLVRTSDKSL